MDIDDRFSKKRIIDIIGKNFVEKEIRNITLGLERETLRIKDEELSNYLHPKSFEPKENHAYITTDYGEAQMEFITPILKKSSQIYDFNNMLYDISALELHEDEFLWPYSMPCKILDESKIKEAAFENSEHGKNATIYRKHLTTKYGKIKTANLRYTL